MKVEAASTWPLIFLHHGYAYREVELPFLPFFSPFFFSSSSFFLSSFLELYTFIAGDKQRGPSAGALSLPFPPTFR